MTWNEHHSTSERLAAQADLAGRSGNASSAEDLYRRAAAAEASAAEALGGGKQKTLGITVVSSASLWYKGREYASAERLAYRYLADPELPSFAVSQLQGLLQVIWSSSAAEKAGIRFVPGDVLVSVQGGLVVHGGAPLDLIVQKVEGIQAVLFRTVEMLLGQPLRRRGGPPLEIQSLFRPWLFQAPAGSYQFAVRVEDPQQMGLFEADRPKVAGITSTFLSVLRASATDPEELLPPIVADPEYREAFLNLSRNLAPTGKTFDRLEVRDASAPALPPVSFGATERQGINAALRKAKPAAASGPVDETVTVRGVLRGLHLDRDWLEVAVTDPISTAHIEKAGDVLDDVIGPMVNRSVVVTASRRGKKLLYRDIELEE